MKTYNANLFFAGVLFGVGLHGYFFSDYSSPTALIPLIVSIILVALYFPMKKGNTIASHAVVVITVLMILALIFPLVGSVRRDDPAGLIRVLVMMISGLAALIVYVKSFIDARRNK